MGEVVQFILYSMTGGIIAGLFNIAVQRKKNRPELISHGCRLLDQNVYTYFDPNNKTSETACPYLDQNNECKFKPNFQNSKQKTEFDEKGHVLYRSVDEKKQILAINKNKCYLSIWNQKSRKIDKNNWKEKFMRGLIITSHVAVILTVFSFWLVRYFNYVEIKNNIGTSIENNMFLVDNVFKDKNREWMFLNKLSNTIFKENWNYISNHYNETCFDYFRSLSLNIDSMNSLIALQQIGKASSSNINDLHTMANILITQLDFIKNECRSKIF